VAKGVRRHPSRNSGTLGCRTHSALDDGFVQVVPALVAGGAITVPAGGWEDPLPTPSTVVATVLPRQGVRQLDPSEARGKVPLVQSTNPEEVAFEVVNRRLRQDRARLVSTTPSRVEKGC